MTLEMIESRHLIANEWVDSETTGRQEVIDVAQDSEIVQREVFGPVVTVQRGSSLQQLLTMANDVHYGLAASVWTEDLRSAQLASRTLNFGTVWVNQHGPSVAEMPSAASAIPATGSKSPSPLSRSTRAPSTS